jgi:hypothetical protein
MTRQGSRIEDQPDTAPPTCGSRGSGPFLGLAVSAGAEPLFEHLLTEVVLQTDFLNEGQLGLDKVHVPLFVP